MSSHLERRRYPRVGCRLPVVSQPGSPALEGIVCDLSLDGLRVQTEQLVKAGENYLVHLGLPSRSSPLQLELKALPPARGDQTLMRQVFVNLFSNAFKFTRNRDGGRIEIGSRSDASENFYYVKDNGVGFDPKYSHKLFGVFQRLHHEDEFEGTGVGLALVQRIIHRHGGRIWAEAQLNEGATFYFTLPKEKP